MSATAIVWVSLLIPFYAIVIYSLHKMKGLCFTKKQAIKAFKLWNSDFIRTPEAFMDLDDSYEVAEKQAEYFIEYLNKVKN